jgi:acyl dehydratase
MKFADFHPGQVLEFGKYSISESEIVEFAARYDPQRFHTDRAWAANSRWKGVIGSGFQTCAVAMRMLVDNVLHDSESIGSPGFDYLKWPNPVRPEDSLRMRVEVLETRLSNSGRIGSVRWRWVMLNQKDLPVLDLIATSLFALRDP